MLGTCPALQGMFVELDRNVHEHGVGTGKGSVSFPKAKESVEFNNI